MDNVPNQPPPEAGAAGVVGDLSPKPLKIDTEVHLRFKVDGRLNPAEQTMLVEVVKQVVAGYNETRHVFVMKMPKEWTDEYMVAFMARVNRLYEEAMR
jgi:hypothetical protein